MLGLQDRGGAAHHLNVRRLAGDGALQKWRFGAPEFADEQPRFVVDVVHVRRVGVPKHRQPIGLVPSVEALPFGRAHGGQPCRKHVVHVQMSFSFRQFPGQVGTGGQAVLPQAGVQFGVQFRQPPPLTFKRLLVLRPRPFTKAPILDALDVGQVLEHLAHLGQFVVHGRKIVQHHLGPRHKPVKRQRVLRGAHHAMQPHQDLQRVRRRPRRRRLDEARQRVELGQAGRACQPSHEAPTKLGHGPVAWQHHGQAVELVGLAQRVVHHRFEHLVQERRPRQGGWERLGIGVGHRRSFSPSR